MKFEEFNQLAIGNRSTLLLAMELLMQNGREFIQDTEKAEIVAQLKSSAGKLIAENVLAEVTDIAKELALLRTCEVLEYVKRSGLEFELPNAQKPGICPVCGGELEYIQSVVLEDGQFAVWSCPECGSYGKEGYNRVFDKHYDVINGDGKPFNIPNR